MAGVRQADSVYTSTYVRPPARVTTGVRASFSAPAFEIGALHARRTEATLPAVGVGCAIAVRKTTIGDGARAVAATVTGLLGRTVGVPQTLIIRTRRLTVAA